MASRNPTRATLSLHGFSQRGGHAGRNIDGWGVAFCDGRDIRLYKEPEPAADSRWLAFVEQRRIASRLILSHLRHATRGDISLANTQPFVRELGGRAHVFAHNGRLDDIALRAAGEWQRFRPLGETDSEIAFCILLERLSPLWAEGTIPPLVLRLEIVARFAAEMRALGPANFLYADGDVLFAHGHRRIQNDGRITPPGLWRLQRRCVVDADALSDAGVVIENAGTAQELTLIASVPLTREQWVPFEEGEITVVKDGTALTSGALMRTQRETALEAPDL